MAFVALKSVLKQYGTQVVLEDVSFELAPGEIVGLVGPNGCGKTTILNLIRGQIQPDTGSVVRSRHAQCGYLAQEPQLDPQCSLHDEVLSTFDHLVELEHELHAVADQLAAEHDGPHYEQLAEEYSRLSARFDAEGGYTYTQRMNEILSGLGFAEQDHALPISALSGGQKCRAALAKLLLAQRPLLLLDEPTNHLDIDACQWLERFLTSYTGGAVVVSHDRYFLDRVVQRIIELRNKTVFSYPGNYSSYVQARELRDITQQRQYEKDSEFIEKERAFIAKHIAGQRTKEAQGRRTRLERRLRNGELVTAAVAQRRELKFEFDRVKVGTGSSLTVRRLSKSFDENHLFKQLNFQVEAGEHFAITGPNGTGKTSLLRILMNELVAEVGEFEFGLRAAPVYYAQDAVQLSGADHAVEYIHAECPEKSREQLRNLLGAFQFTGEEVFKPLNALSGGEQSRLRLLRLILRQPNMLILDEPTNHLDIQSREALESALRSFPGALLVVSHDRYFLDRVANRLLVMRPEGCQVFAGNYSAYVAQREQEQSRAREADRAQRKKERVSHQPQVQAQRERSQFDNMTLEEIEVFISEHERRLADFHVRFADEALYRNPEKMKDLRTIFEQTTRELAEAEEQWILRSE